MLFRKGEEGAAPALRGAQRVCYKGDFLSAARCTSQQTDWSPVCRVPSAFSQERKKDVRSHVCVPMHVCVCAQCITRGPIKLNDVTSRGHFSALLKLSESLASLQPVIPLFGSRQECKCVRGCSCYCHCVKSEACVGRYYLLCITMARVQPSSCVTRE